MRSHQSIVEFREDLQHKLKRDVKSPLNLFPSLQTCHVQLEYQAFYFFKKCNSRNIKQKLTEIYHFEFRLNVIHSKVHECICERFV